MFRSKMQQTDLNEELPSSLYGLRNKTFMITTVVLVLLCLLLLGGLVGVGIIYKGDNGKNENKMKVLADDTAIMMQNLKTALTAKLAVKTQCDGLQRQYDNTVKLVKQTRTNQDKLTEEMATLKAATSQLAISNSVLSGKLAETKKSRYELEYNNKILSETKQLLESRYDAIVKRMNELQEKYKSLIKDRDDLQNKLKNREQLQKMYNDMIGKVEQLVIDSTALSSEKDELESSHQNLTIYTSTLEATCALLVRAQDELRASIESLTKEKRAIESNIVKITAERDQLKVKSEDLTAQRDQLQEEIQKLKATNCGIPKECPSGWFLFENKCYYRSIVKKSWAASRQYCLDQKAELLIINSKEEMLFANSLYPLRFRSWLGLTDHQEEGVWKWVDGSSLTLAFWAPYQPNSHRGSEQDCVELLHRFNINGAWNDDYCASANYFICEM